MGKYLLITDKEEILNHFNQLLIQKKLRDQFDYAYSYNNMAFVEEYQKSFRTWMYKPEPVNVNDVDKLLKYDIIFSLHCKQIFPKELIEKVKCINVHPGLNPYNRGWYPQVFSILNRKSFGVTIHEIDEKIDHGPIIAQKEIEISSHDTSLTIYNKVIKNEMVLLNDNLENIINKNYTTFIPEEGNINYKKDFDKLGEIDVNNVDTFFNHINKLRALSHGDYKNAHFIDYKGNKIFIKIELFKQ